MQRPLLSRAAAAANFGEKFLKINIDPKLCCFNSGQTGFGRLVEKDHPGERAKSVLFGI